MERGWAGSTDPEEKRLAFYLGVKAARTKLGARAFLLEKVECAALYKRAADLARGLRSSL